MVFKKGGRSCSVPQCSNCVRKSLNTEANLSFYLFPLKNKSLLKEWVAKICSAKEPSKWSQVCSEHFTEDDFILSRTGKQNKKYLKPTAVPSQKLPKRSMEVRKLTRAQPTQRTCNGINICGNGCTEENDPLQIFQPEVILEEFPTFLEGVPHSEVNLMKDVSIQVNTILDSTRFSVDSCCNDAEVLTTTGFQSKQLFHNVAKEVASLESVNGLQYNALDAESRLLLTAMKLKHNISYALLSVLFKISQRSVSNYFKSMLVVLKSVLSCALFFPDIESVRKNPPTCFLPYQSTRVLLDCTEIPIEKPKCLNCRYQMYSNYKQTYTAKFLIGVTPSGMISLVSNAYGGRCSNNYITLHSGVLDKCESHIDSIMVDKGLMIEEECFERGLKLCRPPFLRNQKQSSLVDKIENRNVVSARVHFERAIQRLKVFAIGRDCMEIDLVPYATEIITICACLVNLSSPILSDARL